MLRAFVTSHVGYECLRYMHSNVVNFFEINGTSYGLAREFEETIVIACKFQENKIENTDFLLEIFAKSKEFVEKQEEIKEKEEAKSELKRKYPYKARKVNLNIGKKPDRARNKSPLILQTLIDDNNVLFKSIINYLGLNEYENDMDSLIQMFKYCVDYDKIDLILWCINESKIKDLVLKNSNIFNCNESEKNILEYCVLNDKFAILLELLWHIMINHFKCNNFNDLIKNNVLNEKMLLKWINETKYSANQSLYLFLSSIYQHGWKNNSFEMFRFLIEIEYSKKNKNNETNDEVNDLTIQFRKDYFNAMYLKTQCKKETLNDLNNIIINALNKQECGFNDSLLILSKLIDSERFLKTMENVTQECLTNDKKNARKYLFFKNLLLNSNVWAMDASNSNETKNANDTNNTNDTSEVKTDMDPNSNVSDLNEKIEQSLLLFDEIKKSILNNELKTQQMFIQNNVISEENNNLQVWNKLKLFGTKGNDGNITQDKIEGSKPLNRDSYDFGWNDQHYYRLIEPQYIFDELPNDGTFDAPKEYSQHGFLTDMLIGAHSINPRFQNECQSLFSFENFGVKCAFASAPVKTKARYV